MLEARSAGEIFIVGSCALFLAFATSVGGSVIYSILAAANLSFGYIFKAV
jgi:hypothetical protein